MTQLTLVSVFICISCCALGQAPEDFILSHEAVRGKVHKIYQSSARIPPGMSPEDPQKTPFELGKIIEFNSTGQYITILEVAPAGYVLRKTAYSFNAQNKPVTGDISYGRGTVATNLTFSRDSKGKLSGIQAFDVMENVVVQDQKYSYRKNHLEIDQNNYGQSPAHYRHRVENGRLVESILFDKAGNMVETTVWQYNSSGFPERTVVKNASGAEINNIAFTYEFDEKGNWIKERSYDRQTDKYKLRTQHIIYEGSIQKIPAEKELQGAWNGWLNEDMQFVLDEKYAQLKIDNKKMEARNFHYNVLSGEFSLSDVFLNTTASFAAWLDGDILMLRQSSPERTLYFTKSNSAEPGAYNNDQNQETEFIPFREDKLAGIKTGNGKVLLPAEYEDAYRANRQLIKAKKNGKWALFSSQGKQLTEFQFQEIRQEADGYLVGRDAISTLFAPDGKKILQGAYEKIRITDTRVVWVVQRIDMEELHGIFDLNGNVILPVEYKLIDFPDKTGEAGAIAVSRTNTKSTIWFDKNFKEIKTFPGQVRIQPLGSHFLLMQSSQLKSVLDKTGRILIEPVYEELRFVSAHLLAAKKAGKFGLINIEGQEIAPFVYDNILSESLTQDPAGIEFDIAQYRAAALFVKDSDFGYLNGYGKEVTPIPVPLAVARQLTKTFEIPGLAKFSYPYNWTQQAGFLDSGNPTGHALLRVKSVAYSGKMSSWLQNNYPNKDWKLYDVNNKQVYSSVETPQLNTGGRQEGIRSQKIFIPVNDHTALEFNFDCTSYFYPHLAQDFLSIIHSLALQN